MSETAILAEGLKKSFGDVHALKGIDLSIREGSIFGLLGPNGAGKTTAVRILTTLLRPDAGRARVAGFDVVADAERLRSEIGLAAIAITLLDVVVFAPIAFVSGNVGSLFKQFGLTIAVATLFSLLVCFTLTPMLASRWLKGHDQEGHGRTEVAGVSGALIAMAAAAGIALTWTDLAELSKAVPLMARVYPNGKADVNHFNAAGGMGFLIRELLDAGGLLRRHRGKRLHHAPHRAEQADERRARDNRGEEDHARFVAERLAREGPLDRVLRVL